MKNKKITRKITQGIYVLTTNGGGCIVDAVSQVSTGNNPLITVAVMKKNYTNQLMHKNNQFALSVLCKDVDHNIIKTFGLNSMRDIDKFKDVQTTKIKNLETVDDSLGYMICEKIDSIENETHTLYCNTALRLHNGKRAGAKHARREHSRTCRRHSRRAGSDSGERVAVQYSVAVVQGRAQRYPLRQQTI